tara:strand:+ start:286 stop:774 length:489 start_codon:yes stop_codon:yes gene_type:complete
MDNKRKYIRIFFILLLVISIDQVTKIIAYQQLFLENKVIHINTILSFRPVWNNGISFGMFQDFGNYGRFTFSIIAIIISCWLIWSSIKINKFSAIAYLLIAGGALGNVLDRIFHGKVVDFIDFHYYNWHWPAFNFADSFIFIGVALYIYSEFILSKEKNNDY